MPRWSLNQHQRTTLEAAMARIIPTDETPGAREAGTIEWLDGYLSGERVHAKPDGSGFLAIRGKAGEAWAERIAAVRDTYRAGVDELDRLSRARGGCDFVELDEVAQDAVLAELEQGGSLVRTRTQAQIVEDELGFFPLLVMHTRQAFYSDPVYGGNRDFVGWKLVGFHGPSSMREVLDDRYTTDGYLA